MSTTAGEVKRWMYRYLQDHAAWFDSPEWNLFGDEIAPQFTAAHQALADYVQALPDDDPRFIALANALNDETVRCTTDSLEIPLHVLLTSEFRLRLSPRADSPKQLLTRFAEAYGRPSGRDANTDLRRPDPCSTPTGSEQGPSAQIDPFAPARKLRIARSRGGYAESR
jgi:hypothetical protein